MADTLFLIDTYSLLFQVFHAIPTMTSPQGQPTNALYGITRDLQNIIRDHQPTHLICALEGAGPATRNDLYPAYKANRSETPPDLKAQIPRLFELIEAYNIPCINVAGWEADDVIATLSRQAAAAGMDVRIVTSDKDARQLITPQVRLYNTRKNTFMTEKELADDWGIRPDQVIDFQALVGDSVDNVPGVPLVGPKKAKILLEQFDTLENVLANADQAKGAKLQQNLKEFAEQALLSRQLVTLNQELPLDVDFEAARVTEPNREKLLELFQEFGFRRFSEEIQPAVENKVEQTWEIIDTPAKFEPWFKKFQEQQEFCVDLETTSLTALQADIVGWAFCWEANHGYYLPVNSPGSAHLDADLVASKFKPILEDPTVSKINQNIKYDMLVLRKIDIHLQGVSIDPMVGDYLLDAGARSHGLDALAMKYLNHKMIPISDLIGKGKQQKKMFEVEVDQAAEYAAEDATISLQIAHRVKQELEQENLWDLYWDLERPLISVLVEMESNGIKVLPDELREQSEQLKERLFELEIDIYKIAGQEFNIGSPKQLREILFDKLNLPVIKRTKTGPSTDQEVLEQLATEHELPAKLIEQRQLSKLKSTYLDALPNLVHPQTGKIHASFNQVVAATGRLSSSDPNLQNIPVRSEEGRRIRKAFVPSEEGWALVCFDYSQIELRMLAHFCGDPALMTAFSSGEDIHATVAAEIFHTIPEEVSSDMRRVAKAVNFGVIYGQSPYGLAAALKIPQDEAADFIKRYFERFADVEEYLFSILVECEKQGYVSTIMGRRRIITGVNPVRHKQRNLSDRTAINTVIQGSAADLIKKSMIECSDMLKETNFPARLLLQIHDELVFETPVEKIEELANLVRGKMENAIPLTVPLVVDMKSGPDWYSVEAE
ncbi:DNA polymerase I [Polystyrenella longa]|uniref:DNA polymerase I n=1 Tax=Polystyrenella longa TaxID=2528007 RepID=A0A518CQN2_9PLAN|nr:DNA polymerase I [Polystyrenella longa]QDU81525.1 DNA polymerase I [Polystyrenella longa]